MTSQRSEYAPQLFRRKGLRPRTLKFLAAIGDIDAVRVALVEETSSRRGELRQQISVVS